MAKKLSHITLKLITYLQANYSHKKIYPATIQVSENSVSLPEPMQIAFVLGEAWFRISFFNFLQSKHIQDPQSQFHVYEALILNKKYFVEVVQHSELLKYFNFENVESNYSDFCYQAYCICLADVKNRGEQQLFDLMTKGFVSHFYPMLYQQKQLNSDPAVLKKILVQLVKAQWELPVEIKESFLASSDTVNFSLKALAKGHEPIELIQLQGKRLKPTRINAYQEIIKRLGNKHYQLELPKKRLG